MIFGGTLALAQRPRVLFESTATSFPLVAHHQAASIYVAPGNPETIRIAAKAFAEDVKRVTGVEPQILTTLQGAKLDTVLLVGVLGSSPEIDRLPAEGRLQVNEVAGHWESAITSVVAHPAPGIGRALVIAGSDRRGVAFALFSLSRAMGVSPWVWWADVPAVHHDQLWVKDAVALQHEPSVPYRGIFLNDEDWGLRPWAAHKMDPALNNVGPHTYERIFELLLRLHANTLWPAMHPGTLAFNAVPENAVLADRWGIVMGSSHSEALLRNNVGEWDEKRNGPWNYQVNRPAIDAYWNQRLDANARYENFYTVGMRGVHDTGLEATGSPEVKAHLVEDVMTSQRHMLQQHSQQPIGKIPQVIWLYKESLELYRAGMHVPEDVTLGWTDDNYGYLRQLPTTAEQQRPGGSGIYYHVSYWGFPHDHLWLSSTPPALIREELTKAYDHDARRYWVLNVGDIKPAETDIDYFMQLAEDEPAMAKVGQRAFLDRWIAEQFPLPQAATIAALLDRYYQLNFVRRPEFMGFNGYDDGINRTEFNPLAWGDQNRARAADWKTLRDEEHTVASSIPGAYRTAYFELVQYPIEAAAAQNEKFLSTDRSFLDASRGDASAMQADGTRAQAAYDEIQGLTKTYNSLADGKWDGIMSAAPRHRHVFEMPAVARQTSPETPLPKYWGAGSGNDAAPTVPPHTGRAFLEQEDTVSIRASDFTRKQDGLAQWQVLDDLGISGTTVVYGRPGAVAAVDPGPTAPWLEYDLLTTVAGPAKLTLHMLPTFAIDSAHRLRYGVQIDGGPVQELDASGSGEWHENSAPTWARNVLRSSATAEVDLGSLAVGKHTLRLLYRDPAVAFEHLVITHAGAPPAYPVPPESRLVR